jgi:hypothetical protein
MNDSRFLALSMAIRKKEYAMPQAVQPSQIKEHMDVIAADGAKIGSVDHMQGTGQIKLTKSDAPDGQHHFIPMSWVDHVDQQVHLNKAANDAKAQWKAA